MKILMSIVLLILSFNAMADCTANQMKSPNGYHSVLYDGNLSNWYPIGEGDWNFSQTQIMAGLYVATFDGEMFGSAVTGYGAYYMNPDCTLGGGASFSTDAGIQNFNIMTWPFSLITLENGLQRAYFANGRLTDNDTGKQYKIDFTRN